VTKDNCDKHPSLFKLKIRKKGKTWAFGCPYCNFLQWKDKDKGKGEKQ
jgi:DNA topoisomerase-1